MNLTKPFNWRTCVAAVFIGLGAVASAHAQKVKLATTAGDIVVQLDAQKAPKTVANFVQYVKAGHFNGTIFHRVIGSFMIQGGGFTADMKEKPTKAPIALEAANGLKNDRGTIAMARTQDPNSATSQFFINVVNNSMLNASEGNDGYAVFGKVVRGMDVVDKIRAVKTTTRLPHRDVPAEPITITKATLEK